MHIFILITLRILQPFYSTEPLHGIAQYYPISLFSESLLLFTLGLFCPCFVRVAGACIFGSTPPSALADIRSHFTFAAKPRGWSNLPRTGFFFSVLCLIEVMKYTPIIGSVSVFFEVTRLTGSYRLPGEKNPLRPDGTNLY